MRALTTAKIIAKKLDYKLKDIVVDDRLYTDEADDLLNRHSQAWRQAETRDAC